MPPPQARYWILTIPHAHFTPYLPPGCVWIRGQLELGTGATNSILHDEHDGGNSLGLGRGTNTVEDDQEPPSDITPNGYLHWQLCVCFTNKIRLRGVRTIFGPYHAQPTKSAAANDYVWKDETSVAGTKFELGELPVQRNSAKDWDRVRQLAKQGDLDGIEADIYIRYYSSLRRISQDHLSPTPIERTVVVYWGPTGVGKSRRAWHEAGPQAYPKDPRSKFWDGYRGGTNVILDEFRGTIDISHILRWFDRYPVLVEVKGSSQVLQASHFWVTTNLHPERWYPDIDPLTLDALLRRLTIIEMTEPWEEPPVEIFELEPEE